MQWTKTSVNGINEIYELSTNGSRLAMLTLHPFSNTARVETADQKRVFLIRKEGFLRNRTVIRNEYGIKIGEFGSDTHGHFIFINDEKLYHSIEQGEHKYLVISKNTQADAVVKCRLPEDASLKTDTRADTHPGLLMVLCWYLMRPVESNTPKPQIALTV